jgi:hypothetical protein
VTGSPGGLGATIFVVFAWDPARRMTPRFRGSSIILRDAPDMVDALPHAPAPPAEAAIHDAPATGRPERSRTGAELGGVAIDDVLPPIRSTPPCARARPSGAAPGHGSASQGRCP